MSILDRLIAYASPEAALKRSAARKAMTFLDSGYGNYGASQSKKSMIGWMAAGGDAKLDIEDNLSVLRQRSRDAYMGIPIASGALKTMRTNVIASGLVPTPQLDADFLGMDVDTVSTVQATIQREFSIWADDTSCDADRIDDFYSLQQLAFLGYLMNGDAFAVLQRKPIPGNPYDLRVRVIEADRVCSPENSDRLDPCTVRDKDGVEYEVYRIVEGIETDADGVVIAYWISDRHPLSAERTQQKWTRIEAYGKTTGRRNVLHIMNRERAGQLRGVPILAPVLESLKQLGRYSDAELTAAVVSSCFTVFVQKDQASTDSPFGEMLPPDMLIDERDPTSLELGPGAILDLQPGETVNFANPNHPTAGFQGFFEAVVKQMAGALEIPSEVLFKQFSTSYSAARGALNEFWRSCEMQRAWFAADFCQPIYEEWMLEAVAKGRVRAPGFADPAIRKAYTSCVWNGPARTNLNPVQEVNAAATRISNGLSTASQETAQMTGGSYAANIRQRVVEAKQMTEVLKVLQPYEQPQQQSNTEEGWQEE